MPPKRNLHSANIETPDHGSLSDLPRDGRTYAAMQSSKEAVARGRALKLASPVVMAAPVLKIATFHSSSLGSLVAALPALMALRDSFPGARIESFARAPLLPLLNHFSGVDAAHARPGGGISSQAALMARLHGADFDLALSFSQGSNALLLMWATGAPVRAGFIPSRMDALLTHKIAKSSPLAAPDSRGLRPIDALELVRGVGATPRGERARDFLHLSPQVTQRASELVEKAGIAGAFLLISSEARRAEGAKRQSSAPLVSAAALGELAARFPLVLVGLKPKPALLRALTGSVHPVVDLGGQTDVLTLAALCEMSRGAWGVGQGVLQLARMFDRPTASPREGDAARALQIFGF